MSSSPHFAIETRFGNAIGIFISFRAVYANNIVSKAV